MRQKNGRLVVLVAAVAVAAVALGGALAYRQSPRGDGTAAAPLSAPASKATNTPTQTPATKTPTSTQSMSPQAPSATQTTTSSGQTKINVTISKLRKGRDPQVPYLIGREVRGGAGQPAKIPGSADIHEVARLGSTVLAVVTKGFGTELLKVDYNGVEHTPDVTSMVTTDDQTAVAYAATRTGDGGTPLKGGIVYAETSDSVEMLKVPNSWKVEVLAYLNGKVYFRGGDDTTSSWKLYEWSPGSAKATEIKTVPSPIGLTDDGEVAASIILGNDSGTCSAATVVATGKRLWKTCEYLLKGFTPDGATAFGGSSYGDGFSDPTVSAMDAKTGRLIREWTGSFLQTVPEDDQHFLIHAVAAGGGGDEGMTSSIIRCNTTTGACELATPIAVADLKIGS